MREEVIFQLIELLINKNKHDVEPMGYINELIGQKVLIRTYSAGVWFGELAQKSKNEVILKNARRMWRWKAKTGISLSDISLVGIDQSSSRICVAVPTVWLEAIEIIPCSTDAIKSIEGAENAEPR